jgi:hypothetical protein
MAGSTDHDKGTRMDHEDFGDLRAVFINCTLKRSREPSNTQG